MYLRRIQRLRDKLFILNHYHIQMLICRNEHVLISVPLEKNIKLGEVL